MDTRELGRSGSGRMESVSSVAFGCGPRAGLMVGNDAEAQRDAVATAVRSGITLFDTAALYGGGASEVNLGRAIRDSRVDPSALVISSKVHVQRPSQGAEHVVNSIRQSLDRLGIPSLGLVLLHNRVVTDWSGERPVHAPGPALTVDEVRRRGGVLEGLLAARAHGLVDLIGVTGPKSDDHALIELLSADDAIDVVTVEYHFLNTTAGARAASLETRSVADTINYARLADACRNQGVSTLALRALGGGALVAPGLKMQDHSSGSPDQMGDVFHRLCANYGVAAVRAAWWFACATGPGPVLGGFRSSEDVVAAAVGAGGLGIGSELRDELVNLAFPRSE